LSTAKLEGKKHQIRVSMAKTDVEGKTKLRYISFYMIQEKARDRGETARMIVGSARIRKLEISCPWESTGTGKRNFGAPRLKVASTRRTESWHSIEKAL